MDPGQLTDLRTALVSNVNLAVITVRLGIHKYLEYNDPKLSDYIRNFSDAVSNSEINNITSKDRSINDLKHNESSNKDDSFPAESCNI